MKPQKTRQRIRKTILVIAFFLLPVVINYISPVLIIMGANEGIINGSFLVFAFLFLSSLVFGRLFCGWLCPAGGGQDVCRFAHDRLVRGGKLNWIKYIIWVPWVALIFWMVIRAGGYHTVDFFYQQPPSGISTMTVGDYIRYYAIVGTVLIIALLVGRRPMCHYFCWMAPFMIIGNSIKNLVKWPSLYLRVQPENCINCKLCTKNCPMSLDVNAMVQNGSMKHAECILCGECADNCPKDVIHYSFGSPR
jgi:polyferredoxin